MTKQPKIGFLVTARLKSTRLPQKVLKDIAGMPMLTHMINRIRRISSVDEIVICTSTNSEDDPLCELAENESIRFHRGSEEDVIQRLSEACKKFELDFVLNITADCPLVDVEYAERTIQEGIRSGKDLIRSFDLPHGLFCYGIKATALEKATSIKDYEHTEAWGRLFTDTTSFQVSDLEVDPEHVRPEIRLTVDYPEDFELVKLLFDSLSKKGDGLFGVKEILDWLDANPEKMELNRRHVSAYQNRIHSQSEIRLKRHQKVSRCGVVGYGSIGKRHVKNCQSLGINEIYALRSNPKNSYSVDQQAEGVTDIFDVDEFIKKDLDIVILANPTSLHRQYADTIAPHVKGLFIEKPVHHSLENVAELLEKLDRKDLVTFVGYNLEFHDLVKKLRGLVGDGSIGTPLSFQCEVGQWLPDWHPDEDYTKSYFASKELGGGATLTLSHEIHMAFSLFGDVQSVCAFNPNHGLLDLPVDDSADIMMRHHSGVVSQIHLDFLQRPLTRKGWVIGSKGQLCYDFVSRKLELENEEGRQSYSFEETDWNQCYLDELATFVNLVETGQKRHSMDCWRGVSSLAIAVAALESAESNKIIDLPNWTKTKGIGHSIGTYT